jgi:broad specificity polyphosphatase/5'/3'-nucleotidase SurE
VPESPLILITNDDGLLGSTIGVSGTIGAALEADAYGIPGIAAAITAQVSEWRTSVTPLTWRMTADTDWVPAGADAG